MKKIVFIINPVSGIGRQKVVERLIESHLDHSFYDSEIVYTEYEGHGTELSNKAISEGADTIVAVGGDGSVNDIGKTLIGKEANLAIIPTGSGNGLARHLRIPIRLQEAIEVLNKHYVRSIDTAEVNGRVFLGTAGVGFDARIGHAFATFGKRGFISYARLVFREYFKYEPEEYEIIVDGTPHKRKGFIVSIANSSQYGNNATIAPAADIDDGLLDVCIVRPFPIWAILGIIVRLFNGSIELSHYTDHIEGKNIIIKRSGTAIHLDGEPLNLDQELRISVIPNSLKILVPTKHKIPIQNG